MAMDMYALYAEAVASAAGHIALVYLVATVVSNLKGASLYIAFAGLMAAGSFLINSSLLMILHQLTCAGVKNVGGIFKGGGVSAAITAVMSIIPFFVEPLRLVVSQMVMPHRYLGIPARIEAEEALKEAATRIHTLEVSGGVVAAEVPAPLTGEGVGSLPAVEYAAQTFSEIKVAASYFSAFAGAYGMALGAQWTSDCKKSS